MTSHLTIDKIFKKKYKSTNELKIFILTNKFTKHTSYILFTFLLENNEVEAIKFFFKLYSKSINEIIINIYLLGCYKRKRYLSNKQIYQVQRDSLKLKFEKIPFNCSNNIIYDEYFTEYIAYACKWRKQEIINFLFEYAFNNRIAININNLLYTAIYQCDDVLIKLLIKYSTNFGIKLNNCNGLLMCYGENKFGYIRVSKLLIKYFLDNDIIIDINKEECLIPITIEINDTDMLKLLIKYGEVFNIKLNITESLIRLAFEKNNWETINILIQYLGENIIFSKSNLNLLINIIADDQTHLFKLEFNNHEKKFIKLLFMVIQKNNYEITESLLKYAEAKKIRLNNKLYHLLIKSFKIRNIYIVRLLLKYICHYDIILPINKYNFNIFYEVFKKINIEIYKTIINFAVEHKSLLNYNHDNKQYWKNVINIHNSDIIEMFINYRLKHKMLPNQYNSSDHNNKINIRKRLDFPFEIINKINNKFLLKTLINFVEAYYLTLNNRRKCEPSITPLSISIIINNVNFFKLLIDFGNDNTKFNNTNKYLEVHITNNTTNYY